MLALQPATRQGGVQVLGTRRQAAVAAASSGGGGGGQGGLMRLRRLPDSLLDVELPFQLARRYKQAQKGAGLERLLPNEAWAAMPCPQAHLPPLIPP